MIITAVDPGNTHGAFVRFASGSGSVLERGKLPNAELRGIVDNEHRPYDVLAIEMIASYGMPVGREVFETCVEIGRLVEAAERAPFKPRVQLVYRQQVKLALCHSPRANDATIRQALIDRYGGKETAIGRKANPGPLYGVSADVWSALAIACTVADQEAA